MKKRIIALMLACMMVLSLTACGSSQSSYRSADYDYEPAEAAMEYGAGNGFAAYGASKMASFEMEEAAYDSVASSAPAPTPKPNASSDTSGQTQDEGEKDVEEMVDKIIYSADVTLESTTFDETVEKIDKLVKSSKGYVESSSISSSNYSQKARGNAKSRVAEYTLRVPSAKFSEIMTELGSMGNIPYSHVYTDNVTAQYYDAQAHMKAYKTQETRLLEMMELAETVEDVITIEDRLTELRYEIESLQSQLNNWDRRVSYSTIYLSLQEVQEYTPEEIVNPTFGEELAAAIKQGFKTAANFIKGLLTWLAENLPTLIIIGLLGWAVVAIIAAIRRKTADKRAMRKAKRELAREEKKKQALAKKEAAKEKLASSTEKTDK